MTAVSGEEAARFNAVRLDSFACVNDGVLVEADDQSGMVKWKDKAGEIKTATLGEHAIRIIPRAR